MFRHDNWREVSPTKHEACQLIGFWSKTGKLIVEKFSIFFVESSMKCTRGMISMGTYTGMIKIEGLGYQMSIDDSRAYFGKTIDPKSETFAKLVEMDEKRSDLSYKASDLADELFEKAAKEDPEEGWRYSDCVNFNFDKYISSQPGKEQLDELWEQIYQIENEMKLTIIAYLEQQK